MIGPWIVMYSIVNFAVWIAGPLGPKLPYCPFVTMLIIEEFHEGIRRIAIGALRIRG